VNKEELYTQLQSKRSLLQEVIQMKLQVFRHAYNTYRISDSRKINCCCFVGIMDWNNKAEGIDVLA